jgi:hypothetical protein
MDDEGHELNRDYLDKVYRVIAYSVVKLNEEGNRTNLKFGQYL